MRSQIRVVKWKELVSQVGIRYKLLGFRRARASVVLLEQK